MNREGSELDALEGRLAGTLRPVMPRHEFVQRLRSRIRVHRSGELVLRLQDWTRVMLVFGGVLSGTVVILTLARAFYHLFSRRSG
jgi:hypothetical protein